MRFSKSVNNNSYRRFKFYTSSKISSNYKTIKEILELKERIYKCESSGYIKDRNIYAAKHIITARMAGLAWLNLNVA